MGAVKGNIHCSVLLDIRSESNIQGEIVTRRIRIDYGAILRGSVEIQQPEKNTTESAAKKSKESHVESAKEGAKEADTAVPGSEVAKEEVLTSAIARRIGAASGGWFKSGR